MVKILDCTIRDGGYVNNWDFSDDCVLATFLTAQRSKVDYFEVGYRKKSATRKFEKITDDKLKFLEEYKNKKTKLLVMVNELEYDSTLFNDFDKSPVDGVRVACHVPEIETGMKICEELYDRGYEVFLNIMHIPQIEQKHFDILANWDRKNILTSVYFADSYGVLVPESIKDYFDKFKAVGFDNVSVHTHNNLQMAFANSLCAIKCGAYAVDATVYGMGRGGGNLPIELLIGYLRENSPEYYMNLIEKYYLPIYNKNNWGYSVPSLISGLKDVHPNKTHGLNMNFVQMWKADL